VGSTHQLGELGDGGHDGRPAINRDLDQRWQPRRHRSLPQQQARHVEPPAHAPAHLAHRRRRRLPQRRGRRRVGAPQRGARLAAQQQLGGVGLVVLEREAKQLHLAPTSS
jgi:hypothetical protein